MAVGTVTLYSANKDDLNINALVAGTVKLALITSAYTPDATTSGNTIFANASGSEIAGSGGYTSGGIALTSMVATAVTGGYKFSSASPVWTASGGGIAAWRYGVFYYSGTLWGLTNPLIGYFLGDTTPANVPATTAPNTLTITVPANGWFDAT